MINNHNAANAFFSGKIGDCYTFESNRILLQNVPQRSIYQYHVEFAPAIESLGVKKALVGQASDLLGKIRIFEGSQLYLPMLLKPNSGEVR